MPLFSGQMGKAWDSSNSDALPEIVEVYVKVYNGLKNFKYINNTNKIINIFKY
jgi:hypothetical protein